MKIAESTIHLDRYINTSNSIYKKSCQTNVFKLPCLKSESQRLPIGEFINELVHYYRRCIGIIIEQLVKKKIRKSGITLAHIKKLDELKKIKLYERIQILSMCTVYMSQDTAKRIICCVCFR